MSMMIRVEQACPFCGQFIAIRVNEGMTEQEREEIAKKNAAVRRRRVQGEFRRRWTSLSRCAAKHRGTMDLTARWMTR